jgi:acyl-CoA thioesterase
MEEFYSKFSKKFEEDQFAKISDVKLLEAAPGYAKASMKISKKHLNAAGVVQGGAIFTLADFTFAVASNTRGKLALAIDTEISFFKSVDSGILTAIAKEIALHNRLGTYIVDIINDAGEMIANFKGTVYRKNNSLDY